MSSRPDQSDKTVDYHKKLSTKLNSAMLAASIIASLAVGLNNQNAKADSVMNASEKIVTTTSKTVSESTDSGSEVSSGNKKDSVVTSSSASSSVSATTGSKTDKEEIMSSTLSANHTNAEHASSAEEATNNDSSSSEYSTSANESYDSSDNTSTPDIETDGDSKAASITSEATAAKTAHTSSSASSDITKKTSKQVDSVNTNSTSSENDKGNINSVKTNVQAPEKVVLSATIKELVQTTADTWTLGDNSRPRVDAVDVSSYQSMMTQNDFNTLKKLGVKTVIVKATEGDYYTNPYLVKQVDYANAAGLIVDIYHYAKFNTESSSTSEANYLGNILKKNSFSKSVLVFADMEDQATYSVNIEKYLNGFWSILNNFGYTNHGVYTGAGYLYRDAVIKTVGTARTWKAQYPYTPTNGIYWNTDDGAWQFASTVKLPSGANYTGFLDVTIDYTGFLEDSAGTKTIQKKALPARFVSDTKDGKTFYYFDDGTIAKGQRKINNYYYYFDDTTGAMKKNTYMWLGAQNKEVYFGNDGKMQYGQRYIENKWVWFD
ncbi:GH25 family lysozyme, partial [Liquorilactobacillus sucicola]